VLLTRSPLIPGASTGSSFDLHVLSTPPAFILSQDQTLRSKTKNETQPPPPEITAKAAANLKPAENQTTTHGGAQWPGKKFNQSKNNRYQQTWHTIEFSNNRHLPAPPPTKGPVDRSGATFQSYPNQPHKANQPGTPHQHQQRTKAPPETGHLKGRKSPSNPHQRRQLE
jgi:hypothetical protein